MSPHTHVINPATAFTYSTSGPASNPESPTLIFLHYWGGSYSTFTPIIAHLPPTTSTLAISFPGWGTSTGPSDPSAYTIQSLALNIETLISDLSIKNFILIGHSMGGKVAQLIAGRKVFPKLKGMVLLAPAPPTPLVLSEDMRIQQLTAYDTAASATFTVRNVLTPSSISDDAVKDLVENIMQGNEFAKKAWPEHGMGEDISEEVRGVDIPVLAVVGDRDMVETVEKVRRNVLSWYKGAEMVVLSDCGHLSPIEKPREVAGYILDFVSRAVGISES